MLLIVDFTAIRNTKYSVGMQIRPLFHIQLYVGSTKRFNFLSFLLYSIRLLLDIKW